MSKQDSGFIGCIADSLRGALPISDSARAAAEGVQAASTRVAALPDGRLPPPPTRPGYEADLLDD